MCVCVCVCVCVNKLSDEYALSNMLIYFLLKDKNALH